MDLGVQDRPAPARGRQNGCGSRQSSVLSPRSAPSVRFGPVHFQRKLRTKKGRETYAKRKGIIEPVFGQIKFGRGLRQFLLWGLENVALEWDLWCIGHNLLNPTGS